MVDESARPHGSSPAVPPAWIGFGARLRRERQRAGLTLRTLGERAQYSFSHLSKFEREAQVPPKDAIVVLDAALTCHGELLREWTERLLRAEEPNWFELSEEYEKRATRVRFFHPLGLPGFWQTEGYARRLLEDFIQSPLPGEVETAIGLRQAWNRRLTGKKLEVVITESVLARLMRMGDIALPQVARLIEEAQASGTTLQILPESTPDTSWTVGSFRLLDLVDRRTIVVIEHAGGEWIPASTNSESALSLGAAFNKFQVWALNPTDSYDHLIRLQEGI